MPDAEPTPQASDPAPDANGRSQKRLPGEVSLRRAAEDFDLPIVDLIRWVRAGELPYRQVGRRKYVFPEAVRDALRRHSEASRRAWSEHMQELWEAGEYDLDPPPFSR